MAKNKTSCGITCPITGFCFCCNKKLWGGMALLSIWMLAFSWLWHGKVMMDMYWATADLWLPAEAMDAKVLYGALVLMAIILTYMFTKGYQGTGWKEGLRFGILVTAFTSGMYLITYATQPVPGDIIQWWALGDLIQYTIGGILLSLWFGKN